jgi:hypothetical protein
MRRTVMRTLVNKHKLVVLRGLVRAKSGKILPATITFFEAAVFILFDDGTKESRDRATYGFDGIYGGETVDLTLHSMTARDYELSRFQITELLRLEGYDIYTKLIFSRRTDVINLFDSFTKDPHDKTEPRMVLTDDDYALKSDLALSLMDGWEDGAKVQYRIMHGLRVVVDGARRMALVRLLMSVGKFPPVAFVPARRVD